MMINKQIVNRKCNASCRPRSTLSKHQLFHRRNEKKKYFLHYTVNILLLIYNQREYVRVHLFERRLVFPGSLPDLARPVYIRP